MSEPLQPVLPVPPDWRDELKKHWANVRLGHEAYMLDKIQRQNRIVEVNARNTMTGSNSDDVDGWPEDEEMGVSIGNTINYSLPQSAAPQPAASPDRSLASRLLPWVAAAGLLGTTGFGAAAIALLANRLPPPAVVDTDTDTDTQYAVGFGVPEIR